MPSSGAVLMLGGVHSGKSEWAKLWPAATARRSLMWPPVLQAWWMRIGRSSSGATGRGVLRQHDSGERGCGLRVVPATAAGYRVPGAAGAAEPPGCRLLPGPLAGCSRPRHRPGNPGGGHPVPVPKPGAKAKALDRSELPVGKLSTSAEYQARFSPWLRVQQVPKSSALVTG